MALEGCRHITWVVAFKLYAKVTVCNNQRTINSRFRTNVRCADVPMATLADVWNICICERGRNGLILSHLPSPFGLARCYVCDSMQPRTRMHGMLHMVRWKPYTNCQPHTSRASLHINWNRAMQICGVCNDTMETSTASTTMPKTPLGSTNFNHTKTVFLSELWNFCS